MKLLDFELTDIYLRTDEVELDLHNDYDFNRVPFDNDLRELTLEWKRGKGDWIKQNLPENIKIIISNVSYFSILPRDIEVPYSEDNCLDYIGYVEPDAKSIEEFYASSNLVEPHWHYVFMFRSEFSVRVQTEQAICVLKN